MLTREQIIAKATADGPGTWRGETGKTPDTEPTQQEEKESLAELMERCGCKVMSFSRPIPDPKCLLSAGNVGILPVGDFVMVKGKAKSAKSFVCSILAASYIGCGDFGLRRDDGQTPSAVYFDCEQNEANTWRIMRRVLRDLCRRAEEDNDRFTAINMRESGKDERRACIERYITENKPRLAIIDGLADLCDDFNESQGSQELVQWLMRLTSECQFCAVCVLHINGSDDGSAKMRGHLGTEAANKAAEVWSVSKDSGGTVTVTQELCRNKPAEGFLFRIDEGGVPFRVLKSEEQKPTTKSAKSADDGELRETLADIFADHRARKHGELASGIMERLGIGKPLATKRITQATAAGLIAKDDMGSYYITGNEKA